MTAEKLKMEEVPARQLPRFGIRHMQMLMMTMCATILYMMRSSMSVAILYMTDKTQIKNTDVEVFEWETETQGMILSAFFWGYVCMQVPAGILSKMFGGKPLLLISLIINGALCLATPALAKIGGWVAVCLIRVAMGLTQACFMPSSHTLLGQWAPVEERTRFTIISYAGIQIGTIITMPVCGLLAKTSLGWKLVFYSMGFLSLAVAILFWGLTASSPREHRLISKDEVDYIEKSLDTHLDEGLEEPKIPWKCILTSLPMFAVMCAHTGMNWCFVIFLVEIPTYLRDGLNMNMTKGSALSAVPYAAQWLSSICCSIISDSLINKKILTLTQTRKLFNTIGSFACGLCLIAMSFLNSDHETLAIVVLSLSAGFLGCCSCGFMLNHIDLSPRFGGVMFSLSNCFANLVSIMAPISTGFILGEDRANPRSWQIVFCIAAVFIMVSDVVYRMFTTSKRQPWDDPMARKIYHLGSLKRTSLKSSGTESMTLKMYNFPEKPKKPSV